MVAGVCRGWAEHLGGPVWVWRLGFLLAIPAFGLGVLLYLVCLVSMPRAVGDGPVERSRLAPRLRSPEGTRVMTGQLALSGVFLAMAVVILGWMLGGNAYAFGGLVPLLLLVAGAAIIWSFTADDAKPTLSALVAGLGAVILGTVLFVSRGATPGEVVRGLFASGAVLLAVGVVIAPFAIRERTRLAEAREERIRESERADIAAHLHDSVLQTLALIRSRAGEPDAVAALARAQERDLRRYLYADRPEEGSSTAELLTDIASDIEELHRHPIDVVVTGDCPPSAPVRSLTQAVGEALTNACKHGGDGPISLYAELRPTSVEVWVRDRGPGFDLEAIGADRGGIRRSIRERMRRAGGTAEIRTPLPTGGTEVHLALAGASVSDTLSGGRTTPQSLPHEEDEQ